MPAPIYYRPRVAAELDVPVLGTREQRIQQEKSDEVIRIPECHEAVLPIVATVPVQLLSYYIAVELKRDVDKPRNLAKSVTVE